MKTPIKFLSSRQPSKLRNLAASLIASVSLAGGIQLASTAPLLAENPTPITLKASQTPTKLTEQALQDEVKPVQITEMSMGGLIPLFIIGGVVIFFPAFFGGLIIISEREVGIVVKKIDLKGRSLPPERLIALNGEAGYQADTLAPGWHWGYWPLLYSVRKETVTVVPQGEIALVVAADGAAIPLERILGKVVPCDNFQDARKFLTSGGEKGRQIGFLTAGTYRINTALFTVITLANANKHGIAPEKGTRHSIADAARGHVCRCTVPDGQFLVEKQS